MWSNLMEILTSNVIQSKESDTRFVCNFKERVKIGRENLFSGSTLEVFHLRRLTPNYLRLNLLANERSHEDT